MRLFKIKGRKPYEANYQTQPLCGSGIGRFQVTKTDNANARVTGKRGKWTVRDLYNFAAFADFDTLAECSEWCERQAKRTEASK